MAGKNGTTVLEVKNITKRFGRATAVDDVSFSVKTGDVLGNKAVLIETINLNNHIGAIGFKSIHIIIFSIIPIQQVNAM